MIDDAISFGPGLLGRALRISALLSAAGIALAARPASADVGLAGSRPRIAITSGTSHSCALLSDGAVQCWGSNTFEQLGIGASVRPPGGTTDDQPPPAPPASAPCTAGACPAYYECSPLNTCVASGPLPVANLGSVVGLAAGDMHTCALLAGGTVACWGENSLGQLGTGAFASSSTPVAVRDIGLDKMPAIAIAAGANHTCAVLADGLVKCWGQNGQRQLGAATTDPLVANEPVQVSGVKNVTAIAAGADHTCAVRSNGSVWCWGSGATGQLGNGATPGPSFAVAVSGLGGPLPGFRGPQAFGITAGRLHTCVLVMRSDTSTNTNASEIRCWGHNGHGQLGNGTTTDSATPAVVPGLSNLRSVSANGDHTCAVLASGAVRCWGDNGSGEAGDGTTGLADTPSPDGANLVKLSPAPAITLDRPARVVSTGYFHGCAVLGDGSVRCWGKNWHGQIGDDTRTDSASPSSAVRLDDSVSNGSQVAAGGSHTCASLSDGRVACWGADTKGEVGDGSPYVSHPVPTLAGLAPSYLEDSLSVCTGMDHSCALIADGSVECWGDNTRGQLGLGGGIQPLKVPNPGPVTQVSNALQIACGGYHSCALIADGTIKCWGDDSDGQLGIGVIDTNIHPTPVTVTFTATGPSLGENTFISAGREHTCAVRVNDVWCWGKNNQLQIGVIGPSSSTPKFIGLFGVFVPPGNAREDLEAKALSLGKDHSCALVANGTVRCWGSNSDGQLGNGEHGNGYVHGVDVLPFTGPTYKAIALIAGGLHGCAVVGNGTTRCWGDGSYGQLGHNSLSDSDTATTVMTPHPTVIGAVTTLLSAAAIGGGDRHTCAVRTDGSARCWGDDASGDLGNGDPSAVRSIAVPVSSFPPAP